MTNKKWVALVIVVILAGLGIYHYFIKPHQYAVEFCERAYEYHPATDDGGAYHEAIGVWGPIAKYETKEEAMKMCVKYHTIHFREAGY